MIRKGTTEKGASKAILGRMGKEEGRKNLLHRKLSTSSRSPKGVCLPLQKYCPKKRAKDAQERREKNSVFKRRRGGAQGESTFDFSKRGLLRFQVSLMNGRKGETTEGDCRPSGPLRGFCHGERLVEE